MGEVIDIRTAELAVGHNDQVIRTGSIGSCVVIALYDTVSRVGGMAHAMLPENKRRTSSSDEPPAKYVVEAIDTLLAEIEKNGGRKASIIAKLVGGASMFHALTNEAHSIGHQNIEAAQRHLQELSIPLESQDTGGASGKIAELHLTSGVLDVMTKL